MEQRTGMTRRTALRAAGAAAGAAALATPAGATPRAGGAPAQPVLGARGVRLLEVDGLTFKDLAKDGVLRPYADWRLPAADRARDLVARMTLAEKVGTMVHPVAANSETGYHFDDVPEGAPPYEVALRPGIADLHVTSLLSRLAADAAVLATEHNAAQEIAEGTRLGIPVSFSSDPRNRFSATAGQSVGAGAFTRWPGTLGFAAIGDAALVREFADTCRREYQAVGLFVALSPQADLATEPRWSRVDGTFGERVTPVAELTAAYLAGFQHGERGLGPDSVVGVVKHFAGYGAALNGYDSHYAYGRYAVFPGDEFATHLRPFRRAVAAGAGSVMPTYSILRDLTLAGRPLEQVGAAFNRQLLTELLRGELGFDGVILTDWQVTRDPAATENDSTGGKPWGVEDLTERQRFVKAIRAGVDQFGGTTHAHHIAGAVRDGAVDETRIDESVYRILLQKFQQGLFENPYRDVAAATRIVGNAEFLAASRRAQQRSVVLLENRGSLLPLASGARTVFARGVAAEALADRGMTVTDELDRADLAILRIGAPSSGDHGTDLDFKPDNADLKAVVAAAAAVPTVVAIELDRPAILTGVRERADALVAHFGLTDEALLDVLTGDAAPAGALPFELPASMTAVRAQHPDVACDSAEPLYPYGYGLSYGDA
ncbi:glycoside hydrolase family 3 N-terminal domain-containing protein [Streptomyces sp. B6B3]|uniref:glycoside hydrolase family 3 protein n=1 Tax=Streptomyces sp. B6B3 TaxID=3153570 RepID=UPI00325D8628